MNCFIVEAVAGVVGRADVGACMFFLCSLLAYIKASSRDVPYSSDRFSTTGWKWLFGSMMLSAFAMLTKEQGITVLGVCAVYDVVCVSKFRYGSLLQSAKEVKPSF